MAGNLATDALEAEIQGSVGEFLQMKGLLVSMRASKDPKEVEKAEELYAQQIKVEKDMAVAMSKIDGIKKGVYTFSDIRKISSFVFDLRSHMSEVKDFLSGKTIPTGIFKQPVLIGVGLGILGLLWFIRR